jgi:2-amino-4-hydroxy-6-hydroxymethyldihydropteridine diphosphokinase
MSETAYIGLGANLGDRTTTLQQALHALAAWEEVLSCQVSPFYRSAPVDAVGPDYINAVACVRTTLDPFALLVVLQTLEQQHGRTRPYKNAPRRLDLDLLLYNDLQLQTARLSLPHPRMQQRAFVLLPLQDLCATLQLNGKSLQALLHHCGDQAIVRLPPEDAHAPLRVAPTRLPSPLHDCNF